MATEKDIASSRSRAHASRLVCSDAPFHLKRRRATRPVRILPMLLMLGTSPVLANDWFYVGAGFGMPTTKRHEDDRFAIETGRTAFAQIGIEPQAPQVAQRTTGGNFSFFMGADVGRFVSVELTGVRFLEEHLEVTDIGPPPWDPPRPTYSQVTDIETLGFGGAIVGRVPLGQGPHLAVKFGMIRYESKASVELCTDQLHDARCRQLLQEFSVENPTTFQLRSTGTFGAAAVIIPTRPFDLEIGVSRHQVPASPVDERARSHVTTIALAVRWRPFYRR